MKKKQQIFLLIFIILIVGLVFLYFAQYKKNEVNPIHDTYQYSTVNFDNLKFDIAKIEPRSIALLAFYYKTKNNVKFTSIGDLKNQKEELIFATNGGVFSKTYEPLGLYIENEVTISKLNTNNGEGNFYLQPNGIFIIKGNEAAIIETKKYQDSSNASFAIQSGPLLVIDNKINRVAFSPRLAAGFLIGRSGNLRFPVVD